MSSIISNPLRYSCSNKGCQNHPIRSYKMSNNEEQNVTSLYIINNTDIKCKRCVLDALAHLLKYREFYNIPFNNMNRSELNELLKTRVTIIKIITKKHGTPEESTEMTTSSGVLAVRDPLNKRTAVLTSAFFRESNLFKQVDKPKELAKIS